jgi:hypothetical protein
MAAFMRQQSIVQPELNDRVGNLTRVEKGGPFTLESDSYVVIRFVARE